MANLGYTVKGKPIQQLVLELQGKEEQFKLEVNALAPKLHEFVASYINDHLVRDRGNRQSGRLAQALLPVYFDLGQTFGWLMGNISKLEGGDFPGWAMLNYGGTLHKHKVPVGGFADQNGYPVKGEFGASWNPGTFERANEQFSFVPEKKVAGINYIDEMYVELNRLVAEMQQRLSK